MEFLPIIVILVVFWLLLILPQQRQRKRTRTMQQGVGAGDSVVLTSGIYGNVARSEEDSDRLDVEIADGVIISVARAAVGGVQPPADEADETDPDSTESGDTDRDDADPDDRHSGA